MVCMVLVLCAAVKTGVEDISNILCVRVVGCAYAALTVFFFFLNCVLHCHDLVLHTGSPVRCISSLHCFIFALVGRNMFDTTAIT